jgi:hypothetical protein
VREDEKEKIKVSSCASCIWFAQARTNLDPAETEAGTLVEESSSGRGGRRGEAPSEEEGEGVRKDVGAAEGG